MTDQNKSDKKSILVLGATSESGIFVVREILHSGNRAVLFVRSPDKLPNDIKNHPGTKIVEGSITEEDSLDDGFTAEPIDSVISLIGPPLTWPWDIDTAYEDSQKVLLKVMRKHGVRRVFSMVTVSLYDPLDGPSIARSAMVWAVFVVYYKAWRQIINTGDLYENATDIDWVLFRLPALNGTPDESDEYQFKTATLDGMHVGYVGDRQSGTMLHRAHLGKWLAIEAGKSKSEWERKMPYLSSVHVERKAV